MQKPVLNCVLSALLLAPFVQARADDPAGARLDELRQALRSDDVATRREASLAARRLDPKSQRELLPALIDRLASEKDPQVRLPILETFAALGPDAEPAVPVLIHAVRHEFGGNWAEEQHGRFRAAWALGAIGAAAVDELRPVLEDESSRVRAAAALALGRIGPPAAAAVSDLIRLLGDRSDDVRKEAALALGKIGTAAVEPLVAACSAEEAAVRAAAVLALGGLRGPPEQVPSAILERTRDEAAEVRSAAITAAGALKLPHEVLRPVLRESLADPGERVRLAAINVLVRERELLSHLAPELPKLLTAEDDGVARHAAFLLQAVGPDAAPALVESLRDERTRIEQIADALAGIGDEVDPILTASLSDESPRVRQGAALALGRRRPIAPQTIERLVTTLEDSEDAVQLAAIDSLTRLGRSARPAASAVRAKLREESPAIRGAAIEALFRIGPHDERLLEDYVSLLGDGEPVVRQQAIAAIQRLGPVGRTAVAAVIKMLRDPDAEVRRAAADMVGSHGSAAAEAVGALRTLLSEADPALRAIAAETLGRIGQAARPAYAELASLLEDADAHVRAAAALALGGLELEPDEVRPHLARALADEELEVRYAAIAAIRKFGRDGRVFIPDLILLAGRERERQRVGEALRRFERSGPDPKSLPELIERLSHERDAVRLKAIEFLGFAGRHAAEAVPHLERLREDASEEIRKAAAAAIERIQSDPGEGDDDSPQ